MVLVSLSPVVLCLPVIIAAGGGGGLCAPIVSVVVDSGDSLLLLSEEPLLTTRRFEAAVTPRELIFRLWAVRLSCSTKNQRFSLIEWNNNDYPSDF